MLKTKEEQPVWKPKLKLKVAADVVAVVVRVPDVVLVLVVAVLVQVAGSVVVPQADPVAAVSVVLAEPSKLTPVPNGRLGSVISYLEQ
jgi:hypothetical protein